MTARIVTIAAPMSTDRTVRPDRTASDYVTERSVDFFEKAMGLTRRRFNNTRVAEQFAEMLSCDDRTARRYLAGERTPGGNETLALLLDPLIGPDMLADLFERAEQTLSAEDYDRFCGVMAEAVARRLVRQTNEGAPS